MSIVWLVQVGAYTQHCGRHLIVIIWSRHTGPLPDFAGPSEWLWPVSHPLSLHQPGWPGRASWSRAERELSAFQAQAWTQEEAGSPEMGVSPPPGFIGAEAEDELLSRRPPWGQFVGEPDKVKRLPGTSRTSPPQPGADLSFRIYLNPCRTHLYPTPLQPSVTSSRCEDGALPQVFPSDPRAWDEEMREDLVSLLPALFPDPGPRCFSLS